MRCGKGSVKWTHWMQIALLMLVTALLTLTTGGLPFSVADDFLQVSGPCHLSFPDDHGPHLGHRTEWWYYTGNLMDAEQRRYGFQLTFFRSRLAPPSRRGETPSPASAWRTDQIYLAHAAVTNLSEGRHLQAEKISRSALSMAGAERLGAVWNIHIDNWRTTIGPDAHRLEARADEFALNLTLEPVKALVLHGVDGYSRKGQAPERASCYYSFTRLRASGTLTLDGEHRQATGLAWMDHEFSTAPLEPGISGWDWFSLQLSDQTEIMAYFLRQTEGGLNPASSGTYVPAHGDALHLSADQMDIAAIAHWTSPYSGARYPVQWKVSIPSLQFEGTIKANLADQEMRTPQSTRVDYWEGSVTIKGTQSGNPIDGTGYMEMTGYAKPLEANL